MKKYARIIKPKEPIEPMERATIIDHIVLDNVSTKEVFAITDTAASNETVALVVGVDSPIYDKVVALLSTIMN